MKSSGIVMLTVAGLASAAAAQSGSLSIVPSVSTINTLHTTHMTLSVYGDADFGSHIAGGAFSLVGSGDTSDVVGMDWVSASWGQTGENDRGYAGAASYTGVVVGQVILPSFGILPSPASSLANGSVLLGWFEVELAGFNGFSVLDWNTASDPISSLVLEVYDENSDSFTQLLNGDFDGHGSARIVIVPAPSSVALIGLGGLVAGRRRR